MANDEINELQSLLSEVKKQIDSALRTEEQALAKAHPGEETSGEKKEDTSSTAPKDDKSASAPPADDKSSAPPAADASPAPDASASPAVAAPPADASAAPAPDATADPAADPDMDPQALAAEYAKLPPEALKLHYLACKQAVFAAMGGPGADASGAPPAAAGAPPGPDAGADAGGACPTCGSGSAPPPAADATPPAPAPDAPPAIKSEPAAGVTLQKSESDKALEVANEKLAKAEAAINTVLSHVERLANTPVRKAVTSVADLPKEEKPPITSLSKAEISAKLSRIIENPALSKSDRELINSYSVGTIGVDKITHLFV